MFGSAQNNPSCFLLRCLHSAADNSSLQLVLLVIGADLVDLDLVNEDGSMVVGADMVVDRANLGVDLVVGFQVVERISD